MWAESDLLKETNPLKQEEMLALSATTDDIISVISNIRYYIPSLFLVNSSINRGLMVQIPMYK